MSLSLFFSESSFVNYQEIVVKPPFSSYTLREQNEIIPLKDGGATNDWQGRISLVRLSDRWIMVLREAVSHTDNGTGAYHILFSYNGVQWLAHDFYSGTDPVIGFPYTATVSGATSAADMIIIPCPNGDLITIQHERDGGAGLTGWKAITQRRSTDRGQSWSYEGELTTYLDGNANQNWAFYDYDILGNDIYIVGSDHNGDLTTAGIKLYKSSDNGLTWAKVSTIWTNDGSHYEGSIQFTTANDCISIARQDEEAKTSQRISTDGGLTWGPSQDITAQVGGVGVHQPRLRKFIGEERIYLVGRHNLVYGSTTKNGMWYSDDLNNWTNFLPNNTNFPDSGYCDMRKFNKSTFLMFGYEGTIPSARLQQYKIVGSY